MGTLSGISPTAEAIWVCGELWGQQEAGKICVALRDHGEPWGGPRAVEFGSPKALLKRIYWSEVLGDLQKLPQGHQTLSSGCFWVCLGLVKWRLVLVEREP